MPFIKKEFKIVPFKKLLFICMIFVAICCVGSAHVEAATLSAVASNASVPIGQTVKVSIVLNSEGKSVNAVSGKITFPADLLVLEKVSNRNSIVTLWPQDPNYSNTAGTVSFQGVILNGYMGSNGTAVTLIFTAKAQGNAAISIATKGSSALLNDGQGTNVLTGTNGVTITVNTPLPQAAVQVLPQNLPVKNPFWNIPVSPNSLVAETSWNTSLFSVKMSSIIGLATVLLFL